MFYWTQQKQRVKTTSSFSPRNLAAFLNRRTCCPPQKSCQCCFQNLSSLTFLCAARATGYTAESLHRRNGAAPRRLAAADTGNATCAIMERAFHLMNSLSQQNFVVHTSVYLSSSSERSHTSIMTQFRPLRQGALPTNSQESQQLYMFYCICYACVHARMSYSTFP